MTTLKLPVIDPGPDSLEREIQAKANKAPRVTPDDLQAEIEHVEIVKHVSHSGQVLRWAVLTARNGYAVVGRPSVSVSPENDNAEIGERIALENSTEELWPLLGFRLRDNLHALANGPTAQAEDFPLGKACDLSGEGSCEACQ